MGHAAVMTLNVDDYELVEMPCLRCGTPAKLRFRGPCDTCVAELYAKYERDAQTVVAHEFVPKMNVTPNAVALKDD
jgi:hypothetical protein